MPVVLLQIDPSSISQETHDKLLQAVGDNELWITNDPVNENPDKLSDVVINAGFSLQEEFLSSPSLKWHHQLSAGVDWLLDIPDRENLPFEITNTAGMHAAQVTEHAFAMIFSLSRGFPAFFNNKNRREWKRPDAHSLFSIIGKTMLVVGTGAIGSHIAKVASAHGMHTVGLRRDPSKNNCNFDEIFSVSELDANLPQSDVIVLALPLSPGTHELIGKAQFDLMKSKAIFINVGRGSHVDESALAEALRSEQIHGAGSDTFEVEPLPENSPLWDLDNMIISPHCGGVVHDLIDQSMEYFIKNLQLRDRNLPMSNIVDKKLAY